MHWRKQSPYLPVLNLRSHTLREDLLWSIVTALIVGSSGLIFELVISVGGR
jgi:hypothetical protein